MNAESDLSPFRILIASTPKTGNTWLANLLADVYSLPIRELPLDATPEQMEQLGPRWVVIQHMPPRSALLRWLADHGAHVCTTVRHPCDALLSFFHYARGLVSDPQMDPFAARAMSGDWGEIGPNVLAFVRRYFPGYLSLSAEWMWVSRTIVVRYEELWRDPVGVMQTVTQRIREVPLDRIERSVERCDLSLMRSLAGKTAAFFRRGGSGHWKDELPPEVIEIFRHEPPFPRLFDALGYSLDSDDPRTKSPRAPRRLRNPFAGVERFDNGAPILPFMKADYWRIDPAVTAGFQMPISRTDGPDTFWAWLNAPAADDPRRNDPGVPLISNVAKWIYERRPDLQQAMPDVYGADRLEFIDWFIRQAQLEWGLDAGLIRPVFERYTAWANAPAGAENGNPFQPPLTNLMVYLRQRYVPLQVTFPDLAGPDRASYVIWFLSHAEREYLVDASCIQAARTLFETWAGSPAIEDTALFKRPPITRAMLYVHRHSTSAQQAFPDPLGRQRRQFADWFRRRGQWGTLFYPIYYVPLSEADLAWAGAPAVQDRRRREDEPPITNLMALIHALRDDVRREYPAIFGRDRMDFALWVLNQSPLQYAGGHVVARPLLDWFAGRGLRAGG